MLHPTSPQWLQYLPYIKLRTGKRWAHIVTYLMFSYHKKSTTWNSEQLRQVSYGSGWQPDRGVFRSSMSDMIHKSQQHNYKDHKIQYSIYTLELISLEQLKAPSATIHACALPFTPVLPAAVLNTFRSALSPIFEMPRSLYEKTDIHQSCQQWLDDLPQAIVPL